MIVSIPYNVSYILYRKPVLVSSFRLVAVRRTVIGGEGGGRCVIKGTEILVEYWKLV